MARAIDRQLQSRELAIGFGDIVVLILIPSIMLVTLCGTPCNKLLPIVILNKSLVYSTSSLLGNGIALYSKMRAE
jgi:hypothetical protein